MKAVTTLTQGASLDPVNDDLNKFLETLRDGVVVVGPDMCVKSFNASYLELFALEPGDMAIGDPMDEVLHRLAVKGKLGDVQDMSIDEVVKSRLAVFGTEQGRVERRSMSDGRILDIYRTLTINDEIVSIHVDVTEDVRMEAELERQRLYMESLLANTPDGITLLDKEGNFVLFNERFLELYGIDRKIEWGISYFDLAAKFGDLKHLSEHERRREIQRRYEFAFDPSATNIRRRLGDGRTLNVNKTNLPDGGSVMTMRDMTVDLQRETDLVEARRLAEESSRHKSEFVARMSHEMRTPLNGILGVAALLQNTLLDKQQNELIDVISGSGKVLLRLIDDILDLSKLDAETFEVVEDQFYIRDLVMQCIGIIRPSATERSLAVRFEDSPEPIPKLTGDMVRIEQILLNLLTNAVKFTEHGHIEISLDSEVGPEGVTVALSVSDTGVGIAADKLDQIFNRFYQIDGTVTRKYGGAGLGLAIAQKLVDTMGGTIQVFSELGVGTTFRIRLTLPEAD